MIVLSPLIYMPIVFVVFFVLLHLLARLGLYTVALPFVFFLACGAGIGALLAVNFNAFLDGVLRKG